MNLPSAHILPAQLRQEFSDIFAHMSSQVSVQPVKMRFEELPHLRTRIHKVPEFLRKNIVEVEELLRSDQSDRVAATENLAFFFWPGKTTSDEGYVVAIQALLAALENGLLGINLSRAEASLTLHLVIGHGLKDYSSLRPNSYEANRSCLKAIYALIGCNDQSSLIVQAYARIVHMLSTLSEPSATCDEAATILRAANYGEFQSYKMTFRGFEVTCIELGPKAGRPVILHHASRIPFLTAQHVEDLHNSNIRLLMLLRPGCLSNGPVPTTVKGQHLVLQDATHFFASFAGGAQATSVVGHANGCAYAISSAQRLADLKSLILFLPSSKRSGRGTGYGKLLTTVLALARDSDLLVDAYVRSFIQLLRNDWTFEMVARHLHADGSVDSSAISLELADQATKMFFRQAYVKSAPSIIMDVKAGLHVDLKSLRTIPARSFVFVGEHGHGDENLSGSVSVHRLDGVGEYASAMAWSQLIRAMGAFV